MTDQLSLRLVPDEPWELVQPHLPAFRPRPQGGGTAPLPDRQVFTAIVYVLASGCAWRDLPPSFGVPFQTTHRRFGQWTKAGVWRKIHRAVLDELPQVKRYGSAVRAACVQHQNTDLLT